MMFAAIQAAAFVEADARSLIDIGLSEIPHDCRLARAVRQCLEWSRDCRDWESCMDRVDATYQHMNPVHTINNALICVIGMIYGGMDPDKSIAISVMCGLDTDCNGATVGSIAGAARGSAAFGGKLAGRLNDTVRPSMIGFQEVTMSQLARRTQATWKRVDAWNRTRYA
jgi:ADP-ribosylglycohydrolase